MPCALQVLWSSKMSGAIYQVTHNNIPKDDNLWQHSCENLKSHFFFTFFLQISCICYSTIPPFIEHCVLFVLEKMSEETTTPFPRVMHWSQHHCRQLLSVFLTSWLSSSHDMQSHLDLQPKLCWFERGLKLSTMAGFEGLNCNEQD